MTTTTESRRRQFDELRLTRLQRRVVDLYFRHDLLQREIAELLGISQMQVSRLLRRAIAELQRAEAATGS